jgi:hypothetical protein
MLVSVHMFKRAADSKADSGTSGPDITEYIDGQGTIHFTR